MKLTPSHKLYGLGVIMLVALSICSRNFGERGGPYFMHSVGIAGIAYLLAIRELFSTPKFPQHVMVIGLALSALWHLPFLLTPPVQMMTFIDIFGMAACSGSAITHISSFPAILRSPRCTHSKPAR